MPIQFELHCETCPYNPANGQAIAPTGRAPGPLSMEPNSTSALLIFQAPGPCEWDARKPICSDNANSAAARIRSSLERVGKLRTDFSITNATQCYSGKANSSRDKAPSNAARKCCANWLKLDFAAFPYSRIVVFGTSAKTSVTELGYACDPRITFLRHPSGGLSNGLLDDALR